MSVNEKRKKEILDYVRRTGKCLACGRELKYATLLRACRLCTGLYIYQGEVRLYEAPPPASRKSLDRPGI